MFNFTFPWTKRREARKAVEKKAREEALFVSTIISASKIADGRRIAAQRARASAIEPPRRTSLANVPFDGYAAELRQGEVVIDAPMAAAIRGHFDSEPSRLVAGGGAFDGGGASGDWGGSSCSSSGSDSSSGSSDSGSSCSSD